MTTYPSKEVTVVLHFPNGTSTRTVYPLSKLEDAMKHFSDYITDGKKAYIEYEGTHQSHHIL